MDNSCSMHNCIKTYNKKKIAGTVPLSWSSSSDLSLPPLIKGSLVCESVGKKGLLPACFGSKSPGIL